MYNRQCALKKLKCYSLQKSPWLPCCSTATINATIKTELRNKYKLADICASPAMQIPKWMREMQTSLFTLLLHMCVFRCRHVNQWIPKQWTGKRKGFCLIFTPHPHWKLAWSEPKHDLRIYLFEPVPGMAWYGPIWYCWARVPPTSWDSGSALPF